MESTKLYIGQVVDDNYWKDNNHEYPFNNYHSFIKKIFSNIK